MGFVYWDDDTYLNKNNESGTLPDGVYNTDTKIEFCCRTDGNKDKPVVPPPRSHFTCLLTSLQGVKWSKWAASSLEWIYYDTEHWYNYDERGGAYPYNAAKQHPTIYYCHYRG